MQNADAMSRHPPCHQCHRGDCLQHDAEYVMAENTQSIEVSSVQSNTATDRMGEGLRPGQLNNDSQNMREAQLKDDILGPLIRYKETGVQPEEASREGMNFEAHQLYQQWDQLYVQHGN